MRKSTRGRKKIPEENKRTVKVQTLLTEKEFETLYEQLRATGIRFLSDFLRNLILDRQSSKAIINKKEMIRELDKIGTEIGKIGVNINQVAKYANIQIKTGRFDRRTIERFNLLMDSYLAEERKLIQAYRALLKDNE